MESYNLIQNKLLLEIEKSSVQNLTVYKPLASGLKTIKKYYPTYTDKKVYSGKFLFDIDQRYDNLSQMYLEVKGTFDGNTTLQDWSTSYFLKNITLRTKKGVEISKIRSHYTFSRTEQLSGTQLYTPVKNGLSVSAGNTFDFIVPLYLFFSESDKFLKTRTLEDLELEVLVNDTKEKMGTSKDITSISVKLCSLYFDKNESKKLPLLGQVSDEYTIEGYNTYYEEPVTCSSGTTSKKILLNCPYPLFSISCILSNTSGTGLKHIKVLRLIQGSNVFCELDRRINYTFLGNSQGDTEAGPFIYFFSKLKSRTVDSGLITFNQSMYPMYLEVEFDSLGSVHELNVCEEYRTRFNVNKYGTISPVDIMETVDDTFRQVQENVTSDMSQNYTRN